MWYRFSLQIFSETFFILRMTEGDMIKNVLWSSCKVFVILVRLKFEFFQLFFEKNTQIANFIKIRPVGADLFMRTDGQT